MSEGRACRSAFVRRFTRTVGSKGRKDEHAVKREKKKKRQTASYSLARATQRRDWWQRRVLVQSRSGPRAKRRQRLIKQGPRKPTGTSFNFRHSPEEKAEQTAERETKTELYVFRRGDNHEVVLFSFRFLPSVLSLLQPQVSQSPL